jgi:hypothetical protein
MADRDLRLSNHALHLSFNYFDRFLSRMECGERNLQLVSTACMWVAAKVDGSTIAASRIETLVGIEKKHIVEMERWLVRKHMRLSWRSVYVVPRKISRANCSNPRLVRCSYRLSDGKCSR